jgi:outer membrane immunogenic protein
MASACLTRLDQNNCPLLWHSRDRIHRREAVYLRESDRTGVQRLKRIFIAVAAVASLFTTGAIAADLAPRMYAKAPAPVAAVYDWTGFYIGGNVGYSWGRSNDNSTFANGAGTVLFTNYSKTNLDGVVGGGQIGYNWQVQNWVLGLESDIQGTDEKGSRSFSCPTGVCSLGTFLNIVLPNGVLLFTPGPAVPGTTSQKIDWFGTVRGRAGVLVDPKVLVYATGGLAYGEVKTSETVGIVPTVFSSTTTNVGWTIGAGVEGVLGGNWTAKLEYLYIDLGKASGTYTTPLTALGGGFLTSSYSSRITDNVLRVGVNYKFGDRVVAKY